ncbi:MAG: hypothetical protein U0572_12750 [Phycisphaerales bacterium]
MQLAALIRTLIVTTSFAVPLAVAYADDQSPPAASTPADADAGSVEYIDGELVFKAPLFTALGDEELADFLERFRKQMRLPEGVFIYPDADRRLHTYRWDGSDPAPLRQRLKEVLHFERNSRELERAKEARLTATIDFPGGTLGNYVDALVQHFGLPKPVFDPPELRNARMPSVQLNRLDLASAFGLPGNLALRDESNRPIRVRTAWVGPGAAPFPGPTIYARSDKPLADYRQSVCIISRVADKNLPSAPESSRAVFNLISEKGSITPDELRTVMDAIQVAIDLDERSTTFKAKFHEPSGLLIVRGTSDELGVAAQVVRAKLPKSRIELPTASAEESPAPPILKDLPIRDKVFTQPAKP